MLLHSTHKTLSQQQFNSINKSIAKLETIQSMSWSKKDLNLEAVS